jgi:Ca2+/H+ antiporter, TMEM165/GDT1 family
LDALVPAFVAALLAEIGDKTQILAALLSARFGRGGPVLAGIALAALANSLLAALGAELVTAVIPHRATILLVALALLFAGGGALLPQKPPRVGIYDRLGAFAASAVAFFILEFGDKTPFLTFALSARGPAPLLAATGAAAAVVAASLPAVALGPELARRLPVRSLRAGAGILLLVTGLIVAISALRLV